MAAPAYNYAGLTSAQLWQQIRERIRLGVGEFDGITDASSSDTMINALIANDEDRSKIKSSLPEGTSAFPQLRRAEHVGKPTPGRPLEHEFRDGHARRDYGHIEVPDKNDAKKKVFPKLETGEVFAVCKHAPDGYGRTVTCANTVHLWQGTESEYRQYFTPVTIHQLGSQQPPDDAESPALTDEKKSDQTGEENK